MKQVHEYIVNIFKNTKLTNKELELFRNNIFDHYYSVIRNDFDIFKSANNLREKCNYTATIIYANEDKTAPL